MGLAASQVRLLQLTSRQHLIEYEAQKLQAQKLQLSNESDAVYNKYMQSLDKVKVQYKYVESDGAISYRDINFNDVFDYKAGSGIQAQYALEITATATGNEGKYYVTQAVHNAYTANTNNLTGFLTQLGAQDGNGDPDKTDYYTKLFNVLKTGKGTVSITNEKATNSWLTNMLSNGYLLIHKWNPDEGNDGKGAWMESSVSIDPLLQEVANDKEVKKAEATYEAETTRINRKDAQYDTLLSQTETERTAIKTEIDALKNVRNDNIDQAFKLFS